MGKKSRHGKRSASVLMIVTAAMLIGIMTGIFASGAAAESDRYATRRVSDRENSDSQDGSGISSTLRVTITLAEWDRRHHELNAAGTGPANTRVTVKDAVSERQLGDASTDRIGQWRFTRELSKSPCSILVEAAGQSALQDVSGGPSDCDTPPSPGVVLTGLTVSGPAVLDEKSGAQYVCMGTYSDNSLRAVTESATWTENSPVAMINGGYLTVESISADQSVIITAELDGISTSKTVAIRNLGDARVLDGLTISGPATLNEGGTATFIATATYTDGTTATVSAVWEENSAFASISTEGILKAATVAADEPVLVTATRTEGGITLKATAAVTIRNSGEVAGTGSHAGRFSTYEGSATCLTCHRSEAEEVLASVHYRWKGDASDTLGLTPGDAGKLGGINDFCIYPDINWIGKLTNTGGSLVDGGCAKCHIGLGQKPDDTASQAQLENIDCLVCHSSEYKRTVAMVNGAYRFVPDTDKMTVGILEAASDITLPGNDACLNCHSKSGGGDNFKRGDIEEAHRNPTRSFDVHMASTSVGGAGLKCLDCHAAAAHKIAGRGSDLRPRDSKATVACTNCHGSSPHDSQDINQHTARVNCTVCHIPNFAKQAPTDMNRDWSKPGVPVTATGLYEPSHTSASNVVPEYRFFNGKSYFYQFGDPAAPEADGLIALSEPEGKITDAGAKINAFKHHLGNQPIDPVTKRLLPLKIGKFFETGQIDTAVQLGAEGVGWSYNGYQFAGTERYLGLFHEVAPKENALSCNNCHGGGRMDFDALGYTPVSTRNGQPLCASCHERETGSFTSIHSRHVDGRHFDCGTCHTFSKAQ